MAAPKCPKCDCEVRAHARTNPDRYAGTGNAKLCSKCVSVPTQASAVGGAPSAPGTVAPPAVAAFPATAAEADDRYIFRFDQDVCFEGETGVGVLEIETEDRATGVRAFGTTGYWQEGPGQDPVGVGPTELRLAEMPRGVQDEVLACEQLFAEMGENLTARRTARR